MQRVLAHDLRERPCLLTGRDLLAGPLRRVLGDGLVLRGVAELDLLVLEAVAHGHRTRSHGHVDRDGSEDDHDGACDEAAVLERSAIAHRSTSRDSAVVSSVGSRARRAIRASDAVKAVKPPISLRKTTGTALGVRVAHGCSGWNYRHWRDRVYGGAPARWLELYARRFDAVEVNATFYRLPTRKAVAGWAAGTPDHFAFAVKASRYLTHIKRLRDLGPASSASSSALDRCATRRSSAPCSGSSPRTSTATTSASRPRSALPALDHCFEFRHESWFHRDVYAPARARGRARDRRRAEPALSADRVHGSLDVRSLPPWPPRPARQPPRAGAEGWAERIRRWPVDRVWLYFNNDWEALAVKNAERLRELLDAPRDSA